MAVSTDYSYYDFMSHILYGHRVNKIPTATKALCVLPYFLLKYLKYISGCGLRSLVIV